MHEEIQWIFTGSCKNKVIALFTAYTTLSSLILPVF